MKPADVVFTVGWEAYCKQHPYAEWPDCLKERAVPCATRLTKTRWRYRIIVPLSGPLGPHESWESHGETRTLVRTDPETGARSFILSKGQEGHLDVFEAEIDFSNFEIEIKQIESPTSLVVPSGFFLWGANE